MAINSNISDAQLVVKYQSGEFTALAALVKRWHKEFCKKAYWVLKDADLAKDIAQESWKTIIAKLDELKDPNSFRTWAMQIVYRKALDAIQQVKREAGERIEYSKEKSDENPQFEIEELKKRLVVSINSLPENQQQIVRLFYLESYKLKEISQLLNISVGTAKSRLFTAREKLKQTLKPIHHEK